MKYVVYFRGSMIIEAESTKDAWDEWTNFETHSNINIDDVDIYKIEP